MNLGPGAILIGVLTGAIAVYLYVQHSSEVDATQAAVLQQQRCANARFSVRFDRTLSSNAPQDQMRREAAEARAERICSRAAAMRRALRVESGQRQAADAQVQAAAGKEFGVTTPAVSAGGVK